MADSDDDLSHTATDHARAKPASSDDASAETLPAGPDPKRDSKRKVLPTTIGKYRIERELGAGGMGVVYVAFDPDLERRIALKVLRAATSSEAAQRLQREARAMARLKHRNVVTVHEVATAAGQDYVAMELVEGSSLADWLREEKPTHAEILNAFVQAGHGLAAAHAAGIVHRDFKPHNVLRDRAGQVSVTDFGLAREAAGESGDPLAVTMPLAADASTSGASKSSSLAGLTVTGALLGTPAYMAPEQWTGRAVTPATDQFAYCVALWEALTGARPFTGPTIDMLRAQILDGSAELDGSQLPRELRAPLMRGLDADPRKRWSSMDALLVAIAPKKTSKWLATVAIGATAAVAITGAVLSLTGRDDALQKEAVLPCPPPALARDVAWSVAKEQTLVAKKSSLAVAQLEADATAWAAARKVACAAPPDVRPAMVACLDGVLGRFDAAVAAATASTSERQPDVGEILVDPRVCTTSHPPHIAIPSADMRTALAAHIDQASEGKDLQTISSVIEPAHGNNIHALLASPDPCVAMYSHVQQARRLTDATARKTEADLADQGLARCTDARVRADGAVALLGLELRNEFVAASVQKKLREAELAIEPVTQADLRAQLESARGRIAVRMEDTKRALIAIDAAITDFAARSRIYEELDMARYGALMHQVGSSGDDLPEVRRRLEAMRGRASSMLGPTSDSVHEIDLSIAYWLFAEGDAAGSHAHLLELQKPRPIEHGVPASGKVVDDKGAPVAGAAVVAGNFVGDEVGVALADPVHSAFIRSTLTATDGTFSFSDVVPESTLIAQLGDRRSYAGTVGDKVLTLRPTSHLEGTVDLHGLPAHRAIVMVQPADRPPGYAIVAPVQRDGTFHIDGVPRGKQRVSIALSGILGQSINTTVLDVTTPSMTGVHLAAPSDRTLYIVLRSTVAQPLANAEVLVLGGTVAATNLGGIQHKRDLNSFRVALPAQGDTVPAEVRSLARDGDLYVSIAGAPRDATACAIPLPGDISDPTLHERMEKNLAKIPMACKSIPPDAKVLVEDVPPWPRLDE